MGGAWRVPPRRSFLQRGQLCPVSGELKFGWHVGGHLGTGIRPRAKTRGVEVARVDVNCVIVFCMSGRRNEAGRLGKRRTLPMYDAREILSCRIVRRERDRRPDGVDVCRKWTLRAQVWQGWQVPVKRLRPNSSARIEDIPAANIMTKFWRRGMRVAGCRGLSGWSPRRTDHHWGVADQTPRGRLCRCL